VLRRFAAARAFFAFYLPTVNILEQATSRRTALSRQPQRRAASPSPDLPLPPAAIQNPDSGHLSRHLFTASARLKRAARQFSKPRCGNSTFRPVFHNHLTEIGAAYGGGHTQRRGRLPDQKSTVTSPAEPPNDKRNLVPARKKRFGSGAHPMNSTSSSPRCSIGDYARLLPAGCFFRACPCLRLRIHSALSRSIRTVEPPRDAFFTFGSWVLDIAMATPSVTRTSTWPQRLLSASL